MIISDDVRSYHVLKDKLVIYANPIVTKNMKGTAKVSIINSQVHVEFNL